MHPLIAPANRPIRGLKYLNVSLTIFRLLSGLTPPRAETERNVPTDVSLETECNRVRRIVEGLNDELSRELLGAYAADLQKAQQKQSFLRAKLDKINAIQ
jgi:hypothetical protein